MLRVQLIFVCNVGARSARSSFFSLSLSLSLSLSHTALVQVIHALDSLTSHTGTIASIYDLWGENENFAYGLDNWIQTTDAETCLACSFHGATWLKYRLSTYDPATSPCGDVSTWDTSSVRSLKAVFEDLVAFNGDISEWDTSSVTDMTRTFKNATLLQSDLSNWNVYLVEHMGEMANGASQLDFDVSLWNLSQVRNMNLMFCDAISFVGGIGLSNWNVNSVTNVKEMFRGATNLISDSVMSWNVSGVYGVGESFENIMQQFEDLETRVMNLPSLEMTGSIPNSFVSERMDIVDLYLVNNDLTGSLPSGLVDMTNLRRVFVSRNGFSGSLVIPSNAIEFQGTDNLFEGEITTDMVKDTLQILILSRNGFSGTTTTSWLNRGSLSLSHVELDNNLLSGTLSLSAMSSIEILDLSSNLLSGSLPLILPDTIQVLRLNDNAFGGTEWFQNVRSKLERETNLLFFSFLCLAL